MSYLYTLTGVTAYWARTGALPAELCVLIEQYKNEMMDVVPNVKQYGSEAGVRRLGTGMAAPELDDFKGRTGTDRDYSWTSKHPDALLVPSRARTKRSGERRWWLMQKVMHVWHDGAITYKWVEAQPKYPTMRGKYIPEYEYDANQ